MPSANSPQHSQSASASGKHVVIIGATSAIAEATARLYAAEGASMFLMARNEERLTTLAADLQVRGARSVALEPLDANALDRHAALIERAFATLGRIDVVLIAHGTLGDQVACERDFARALEEWNTNAVSVLSLLTQLANRMEAQGSGTIAVITSVAGDRGRASNYVYGTAKGALNIFLQGLRNRLYRAGVDVLTIKPGFVDTPMTAHIEKKGALWATPATVAAGIKRAIERRRLIVYVPGFWWMIMLIIKAIPERIFRRLRL
ncbi:MAG: short-chain dehydrogenase [Conexibacter sp.]|nr:short-chain dehydrogenase [Conexibacter sp.]